MVDNQIRHQIHILPQCFDIRPVTQTGINLGVIDGIEASIGSMNRIIKWKEMNTTKQPSQWSLE